MKIVEDFKDRFQEYDPNHWLCSYIKLSVYSDTMIILLTQRIYQLHMLNRLEHRISI
jgi:hypothetical protein